MGRRLAQVEWPPHLATLSPTCGDMRVNKIERPAGIVVFCEADCASEISPLFPLLASLFFAHWSHKRSAVVSLARWIASWGPGMGTV